MDDLIKRMDAIEALYKYSFVTKEVIEHEIMSIPSAERKGEWVSDYSSPVAYRCTACNTLQHWSVIQNGRYRFCPNCGARMKGADDG